MEKEQTIALNIIKLAHEIIYLFLESQRIIMYRGQETFICSECGNNFEAKMSDWNHRDIIAPAKCPNCGSWYTLPYTWSDFPDAEELMLEEIEFYKPIWKQAAEERNKLNNDDSFLFQ